MKQYETAGFTLIQPPASYSYTWQGIFPIFRVAPGTVQGLAGMVARCEAANIIEWFPYGTSPAAIKARLDDLILGILRHDADIDGSIEFDQQDDWIDIDAWMVT
jgi:hypothetical protein